MTEVKSSHAKKRGIIWIAASFLFYPSFGSFSSYHPNQSGMNAIANAILEVLP
ncbi:hypothetical protein [Shimazuella kribbensis]|uniref:hypothetical protein n=1 Tax=Shimazuella kribbensis TaxID=139808 RepID=UPI000402BA26|nr:hypothetical protein [Shimazuella kribbensis]